jgi:hypothetical protein
LGTNLGKLSRFTSDFSSKPLGALAVEGKPVIRVFTERAVTWVVLERADSDSTYMIQNQKDIQVLDGSKQRSKCASLDFFDIIAVHIPVLYGGSIKQSVFHRDIQCRQAWKR